MPIEFIPTPSRSVVARLDGARVPAKATLRSAGREGRSRHHRGRLVLLDAHFDEIPPGLHAQVKSVPGVLETGLFEGYEYEIVD